MAPFVLKRDRKRERDAECAAGKAQVPERSLTVEKAVWGDGMALASDLNWDGIRFRSLSPSLLEKQGF